MPNDLVSREADKLISANALLEYISREHVHHSVVGVATLRKAIAALPAAGDERPQTAEEIRLEQIESIICQNKRFTVEEQAREIAKLFQPPQEAGDEPGK